jgi:hypothetical protein
MVKVLFGAFMIAHGVVTGLIWATPKTDDTPFDASHSWLLGDSRGMAVAGGLVVAVGFVITGAGFLGGQGWWPVAGLVSGALGVAFMAVFSNMWLLAGIAISAVIAGAGARALQAG